MGVYLFGSAEFSMRYQAPWSDRLRNMAALTGAGRSGVMVEVENLTTDEVLFLEDFITETGEPVGESDYWFDPQEPFHSPFSMAEQAFREGIETIAQHFGGVPSAQFDEEIQLNCYASYCLPADENSAALEFVHRILRECNGTTDGLSLEELQEHAEQLDYEELSYPPVQEALSTLHAAFWDDKVNKRVPRAGRYAAQILLLIICHGICHNEREFYLAVDEYHFSRKVWPDRRPTPPQFSTGSIRPNGLAELWGQKLFWLTPPVPSLNQRLKRIGCLPSNGPGQAWMFQIVEDTEQATQARCVLLKELQAWLTQPSSLQEAQDRFEAITSGEKTVQSWGHFLSQLELLSKKHLSALNDRLDAWAQSWPAEKRGCFSAVAQAWFARGLEHPSLRLSAWLRRRVQGSFSPLMLDRMQQSKSSKSFAFSSSMVV